MAVLTKNSNNLPEELIMDILLRLPVKSLLRFRAVSVRWFSLISSPSFINSHLHRAITNSDNDDNYIQREDDDSISLINLIPGWIPGIDLELPYSKGEFPFMPHSSLIGSCNGIVCNALSDCPRKDKFYTDFFKLFYPTIYLWNPATKQSKLISQNDNIDDHVVSWCHGFGFDSIENDFKVVRIFVTVKEPTDKRAVVYSANNNVWRVVEFPLGDSPRNYLFDVCVKGFLCCIGYDGLITFDLNKVMFNCDIKFLTVTHHLHCITEFKGSVAMVGYSKNDKSDCSTAGQSTSKITLWRLDDACLGGGIEGCWTLMFSVDVASSVECVRCYLNSGDSLFYDGNNENWFLYNLDKKVSEPVLALIQGRIFKYSESLVSITGFQ